MRRLVFALMRYRYKKKDNWVELILNVYRRQILTSKDDPQTSDSSDGL